MNNKIESAGILPYAGFQRHFMIRAMMISRSLIIRSLVAFTGLLVLYIPGVAATELSIPSLKVTPGQTIELPLVIDKVDNLAGVKLVLRYDAALLAYRKSSKTKYSSSLMHIVNDKKPGILIIVMAGARGIKGRDFPIFKLFFQVNSNVKVRKVSEIKITEIQLMSDKLKNIACDVKVNPVIILPDEYAPPPARRKSQ